FLNAKPYKNPLMQNVITLTKEEQLIQPIYTTKLLVSSIYRYMLLSLKIDTNFKILITDKERTIFEKCFQARINCFNILNKDFQTSKKNIALINEAKTKI
ncbi:25091_t:CDS:1, partial [Gigaspora margarita]